MVAVLVEKNGENNQHSSRDHKEHCASEQNERAVGGCTAALR